MNNDTGQSSNAVTYQTRHDQHITIKISVSRQLQNCLVTTNLNSKWVCLNSGLGAPDDATGDISVIAGPLNKKKIRVYPLPQLQIILALLHRSLSLPSIHSRLIRAHLHQIVCRLQQTTSPSRRRCQHAIYTKSPAVNRKRIRLDGRDAVHSPFTMSQLTSAPESRQNIFLKHLGQITFF